MLERLFFLGSRFLPPSRDGGRPQEATEEKKKTQQGVGVVFIDEGRRL